MKIVPLSKFEYKLYPIKENERCIEVTKEDFCGLENKTKCFNGELTKVIDYVKTQTELAIEQAEEERATKLARIAELKRLLSDSDYKALKFVEGYISVEDYAETKLARQSWRNEINDLENQIGGDV